MLTLMDNVPLERCAVCGKPANTRQVEYRSILFTGDPGGEGVVVRLTSIQPLDTAGREAVYEAAWNALLAAGFRPGWMCWPCEKERE